MKNNICNNNMENSTSYEEQKQDDQDGNKILNQNKQKTVQFQDNNKPLKIGANENNVFNSEQFNFPLDKDIYSLISLIFLFWITGPILEEIFWGSFLQQIYNKTEESELYIAFHYGFISLFTSLFISNWEISLQIGIFMAIIRRILNFLQQRYGLIFSILANLGVRSAVCIISGFLFLEKIYHYVHSDDIQNVNWTFQQITQNV
ncbi:hypothetical protein PPERSA_03974 [Pseudocohnilembus persalinus]|uniref:Uncharacterized protein n=1 Tax=Pseudocohnilembus persalinus TaxID=266149 RepID=A0A0V0QB35_PSEPJ|nr:hypothetical protein PPERSA_03974 [Pseudocohnilembus persalinus]|eukprot:KRW99268.1 hypothetical protein PPERSA_03974 [Pseudocohnilembus persalinus]